MRPLTWLASLALIVAMLGAPGADPVAAEGDWTLLGYLSPHTILVNPNNPDHLYASFQGPPPKRSLDGGATWSDMPTGQAGSYVLAAAPTQPLTLYSGELGGRPRLARSVDGGTTWASADTGLPEGSVGGLAVDPTNGQRVYFGGYNAIYRTSDGGASWQTTTLATNAYCGAIAISPANPGRIYAGCNAGPGLNVATIRVSNDQGTTWGPVTQLPGAPRLERLFASPAHPDLIYATTSLGVYRSGDGGTTWMRAPQGLPSNTPIKALAIDPQNPAVVYTGLYPAPTPNVPPARIYRSIDSGATWSLFHELPGPYVEAITVDPTRTDRLYVATSYGLYRYSDLSPPVITEQPLNQRVRPGTAIMLDVIAANTTSYQWYQGESGDTSRPIAGATGRTYTTPPLSSDAAFWIRLTNASGSTDSQTARVRIKGAYTPALDGFNRSGTFTNFGYTPGTALSGASWEIFKRTFSADNLETANAQRRQGAENYFLSPAYQGVGAGGNCFGMAAVSALRYLDSNDSLERTTLNPYYRRFTQIGDLPPIVEGNVRVAQSTVKDYIFLYQGRQQSFQVQGWFSRHARDTPAQTFDAIRQITQAGNVAILVFWYQYPNGRWAGHAVVAYGTEQNGNSATIAIYDSNWPNDSTRRLTVDLTPNQSRWSYEIWPGTTWSGDRDLLYLPVNMLFPSYLDLGRQTIVTPAEDAAGLTVNIAGDADLLIVDSQGRQFGPDPLDLTQEISGAVRLVNLSFNPAMPDVPSSETYYLPAGQPYTVTVRLPDAAGASLAATVPYTLTAFGGGSALILSGTSLSGAAADTLILSGTTRDSTFTPATDGEYCQVLTDEVSAEHSRAYRTCVTAGGGVGARFSISAIDRAFRVSNAGARPFNVTLTTRQVGETPGSGTAVGAIPPGQAQIAPEPKSQLYLPLVRR